MNRHNVRQFFDVSTQAISTVRCKNASLGELYGHLGQDAARAPNGFITTIEAVRNFLNHNNLTAHIAGRDSGFYECKPAVLKLMGDDDSVGVTHG